MIFMTICFSSLDASAKYLSNELPLWVLLWGRYVFNFLFVALLGESVGRHRWTAVLLGFVGVMVVMRPGIAIFEWVLILPLITAHLYAGVQISTRILGRTDGALTTLLYSSAGGVIISTIGVLFFWVTPSFEQWLVLGWMGFLGALGHYLMIKAYEIAPASLLAPFDYTALIWATILGFVMFGDLPDTWTVLGAVIIMSSGLYLIRRESRLIIA